MSKLILQRILTGTIVKPEPAAPQQPIDSRQAMKNNPFLQTSGLNENAPKGEYGVNKPLRHPMFVGYRDDKPIYAGSRLFVLY